MIINVQSGGGYPSVDTWFRAWGRSFCVRQRLCKWYFEETCLSKTLFPESKTPKQKLVLRRTLICLISHGRYEVSKSLWIPNFDQNPNKSTVEFFMLHQMPKSIYSGSRCLVTFKIGHSFRLILIEFLLVSALRWPYSIEKQSIEWMQSWMTWWSWLKGFHTVN